MWAGEQLRGLLIQAGAGRLTECLTGTGERRKEGKQTGKGAVARWVMEFDGAQIRFTED